MKETRCLPQNELKKKRVSATRRGKSLSLLKIGYETEKKDLWKNSLFLKGKKNSFNELFLSFPIK